MLFLFFWLVLFVVSLFCFYKWKWKAFFFYLPALIYISIALGEKSPELLGAIALGFLGGVSFSLENPFQFFIVSSTLILTLIMSGHYFFLWQYKNLDLLKKTQVEMLKALEDYQKVEGSQGEVDFFKTLQEVLKNDTWIDLARDFIFFSYFIYSLFLSAASFFLLRMIFFYLEKKELKDGLVKFKINDFSIFLFLLGWGIILLIDKTNYRHIYLITLNISLGLSIFYLLQAVGIIKFFLLKKGWPMSLFYLGLFVLFLIKIELFFLALLVLLGLGVFDLWYDFRKLNLKKT